MKCPFCHVMDTKVVDSRLAEKVVKSEEDVNVLVALSGLPPMKQLRLLYQGYLKKMVALYSSRKINYEQVFYEH